MSAEPMSLMCRSRRHRACLTGRFWSEVDGCWLTCMCTECGHKREEPNNEKEGDE